MRCRRVLQNNGWTSPDSRKLWSGWQPEPNTLYFKILINLLGDCRPDATTLCGGGDDSGRLHRIREPQQLTPELLFWKPKRGFSSQFVPNAIESPPLREAGVTATAW